METWNGLGPNTMPTRSRSWALAGGSVPKIGADAGGVRAAATYEQAAARRVPQAAEIPPELWRRQQRHSEPQRLGQAWRVTHPAALRLHTGWRILRPYGFAQE